MGAKRNFKKRFKLASKNPGIFGKEIQENWNFAGNLKFGNR